MRNGKITFFFTHFVKDLTNRRMTLQKMGLRVICFIYLFHGLLDMSVGFVALNVNFHPKAN
jgi:hypothetical protein